MFSANVLSSEVMKLQKYWRKKKEFTVSDEDLFNECVLNESVKNHLKIVVDQLKSPKKYEDKNIKLIKGCLVYGKPGTGKTLLARCLSKLDGITFINTCASEFVEIYVGSGPKKIREVFRLARENKPAIIFIDELESIGMHRSTDTFSYTNNIERYSTLNQLLAEMDGVYNHDNIVVIAATNREDLLDSALVRPGRFDYKINLALPDANMREGILKLYLGKYTYDMEEIGELVIKDFAKRGEGLTGANIESIVNDAATFAMSKSGSIKNEDLEEAFKKNVAEFLKFKKFELKNSFS
jgi:cell division protease FtsH